MSEITKALVRRVWDSRGRPTIEAEVRTGTGHIGRAISPAGASRGLHEALERRDNTEAHGGLDVKEAVAHFNSNVSPRLAGLEISNQLACDDLLMAVAGKGKALLGTNVTTSVSTAIARAAASVSGMDLWQYLNVGSVSRIPRPIVQMFGGGAHADSRVEIQDFAIICVGASNFEEACDWSAEIFRSCLSFMRQRGKHVGVADEGGIWPDFDCNEHILEALTRSIELAGFRTPSDVGIALDVAAGGLYRAGRYRGSEDGFGSYDTPQFLDWLTRLVETFPIVSLEDPFAESDVEGFSALYSAYGAQLQIIGDDLCATSSLRISGSAGMCNAVLIKPNQVGTISESIDAANAAKKSGLTTIVSTRSGDTEDTAISHIAVGWGASQIKLGGFTRSERLCKVNELLRIGEALGTGSNLQPFPQYERVV